MKAKFLFIMILLSLSINIYSQSFDELWNDFKINIENQLPQSAESILDKIEEKAVKENNQKEILKTFMYRFKIFLLKDENPIEASIQFAEENINKLQEPEKSFFNLAIASLYQSAQQSATQKTLSIKVPEPVEGIKAMSDASSGTSTSSATEKEITLPIKFWDKATFERVINKYYENALSDIESLQNTKAESYKDVLTINDYDAKFDFTIEPTLYDYVVHKIITLVGMSYYGIPYYGVPTYNVSDLYQNLIDFDKKNNYANAAIYNEIQKLKYEYKNSDDFELYYNSLEKIKNNNLTNPLATSVMALQASAILSFQNLAVSGQQSHVETYGRTSDALRICDEAIDLFPNSIGAKQCESIRSEILEKRLSFSMQNVVLPNKDISATISYINLTNPHYRIYKLSQDEIESLKNEAKPEIVKTLLKKNHIIENNVVLPEEKDYQEHSYSFTLPKLECGTYFIMFSKDDNFSKKEDKLPAVHMLQVSNLSFVTTKENDDFVIYVLDRDSGKPIKDVNVNIYKQTYDYRQKKYLHNTIADLTTDKNGIAKITDSNDRNFCINLFKNNDKLLSDTYFYNYQNESEEKSREQTTFFTDRAIYRPGQTVYYKGIILNQNSKVKELLVGKETKVTFRDSNWQEIATQTFTTNEFGSFDGSFVIPNNLLNGNFSISNESGNISFKVEEYKRPTFEITFKNPDKSFKLNDEVDLSGSVKAYAGFGLDNINYNYTVVRRAYFPYRFWWFANYDSNEKQIAFGEGKTDVDGNFNIDFKLIPDKNEKDKLPVFEYIVTVNVTNAQGETQTKTYTLRASEIDLIIDIDDKYENVSIDDLNSITFNVKNLKENPVEAKIIRKIYDSNESPVETYGRMSPIYEDTINVNGSSTLFPNVKNLVNIGRYVVELISADNEKATTSVELTIVDYHSNKMPYDTMCISYYDKKSVQPGSNVNFYLGSSAKDVNVYVMIKHGDEIRHYERKTINDEVLKVTYKIGEEDRGNITFQAFFVKNNTINIVQHKVSVPYDNLKLDIRLDVVRDDLLPGSEERWNLTIKNYKDEAVIANLLAGMYDASLDVFAKNHWDFNTLPNVAISSAPKTDKSFSKFYSSTDNQYFRMYQLFAYSLMSDVRLIPRYYKYATISARDLMLMPQRNRDAIAASVGGKSEEVIYEFSAPYTEDNDALEETELADLEIFKVLEKNEENQDVKTPEMLIRENFNETAFFYPNLKTNNDGSLTLSFRMPDALTRWNLMMLAYTKDLEVGTLNKTFTTSKPLMIMSDMPRFVYENDTLWIVANVIKTNDKRQMTNGSDLQSVTELVEVTTAKLEVFDALTMEPLDLILSEQEIDIKDIPAGESRSVRWKITPRLEATGHVQTNLLALRFSVETEYFSDAEQHLLPILSDEVFMIETYPITVKANTEETFNFDFNIENERNQGLTFNFCSNPVWYAVQALPYLSQEIGEHADVAFNIFYANSLASYIAHNIPNLLNYIKKWEIETPDALMSALQKDENLKAIMLQETPWVLEAKSEAEQKSRIANLFDVNAMRNKIGETLNLINEKQSVNGGWSWFPGMPESPFITQYILSGFGRLYKMNVIDSLTLYQQEMSDVISKQAVMYLSNEILEDYDTFKNIKKFYISNYQTLNELYALSFFDLDESIKFKTAKNFFVGTLKEDWRDFSFAAQAKIALIFYRNGEKNEAQLIMKSLKERMTQVQNTTDIATLTLVMEAFMEIEPNTEIINELTITLLNNKRTNMWENARSTVDAIYAIIKTTRLQDNKPTSSEFKVQSSEFKVQNSEFIQKYWDAAEMRDFHEITIENKSDNIVWGGLFRQYFVSIDEVRKHESPLNVERNIYIERVNDEGSYLVPIENEDIKVGDKIVVNLMVENYQDMEFVFLKDLRAACFEPEEQISKYKYHDRMLYYQSNSDTFMGFYIDRLPKGKHLITYSMFATKEGSFSNGYAFIQCMYAPEFSAYSASARIKVK